MSSPRNQKRKIVNLGGSEQLLTKTEIDAKLMMDI